MAEFDYTYRTLDSGEGVFYGWFESMHSRFDMLLWGVEQQRAMQIMRDICAQTKRLDKKLNRFDMSSDIYAINTLNYYRMFHADRELLQILDDALRFRELTEGCFDICVATPEYDNGEEYYTVDHNSMAVIVAKEGVKFDLGGYAKGLALEIARDLLLQEGVGGALVSFGGSSIYAIGRHPSGGLWQVGVDNPFFGKERVALFDLANCAMSTSGNSPGNMGHILSPTTGQGIELLRILSICGDSPLNCEVLSTALFAAGDDAELKSRILARCALEGIVISRLVEADFSPTFDTLAVRELV